MASRDFVRHINRASRSDDAERRLGARLSKAHQQARRGRTRERHGSHRQGVFLIESYENLDQLDRDLVQLEETPGDHARLASIFRAIHTIKGTAGFFGFSNLESVTHVGENLLSKLRDGHMSLNPDITSGLLAQIDAIRQMLANIEGTGREGRRAAP